MSRSLRARVHAASELLNAQLGAITHVEENGKLVIRGAGCPLAALTGKHPAVCLAMESLLTEVIGAAVVEQAVELVQQQAMANRVKIDEIARIFAETKKA